MKTTIILSITSQSRCTVEKGDWLKTGDRVAKYRQTKEKKNIDIAKLLKISPDKVTKYLKKSPGLKVNQGEILAEKSSLFQSSILKSPVTGVIKEVDVKNGSITIEYDAESEDEGQELTTPAPGKVVSVGKDKIELEIGLPVLKGKSSKGVSVHGSLNYIPGEKIGVLDIKSNVEKSIVLIKGISKDASVKLETLGAKGAVLEEAPGEPFDLPYIQVENKIFDKLVKHHGNCVWVRPQEKEIVIISES